MNIGSWVPLFLDSATLVILAAITVAYIFGAILGGIGYSFVDFIKRIAAWLGEDIKMRAEETEIFETNRKAMTQAQR